MITSFTPSPQLLTMLQQDEGVRSRAYQDTLGYWTVGVGRNLSTVGLSRDEQIALLQEVDLPDDIINLMLSNDLQAIAHQVSGVVGDDVWPTLTDARQAALINMGFAGPGMLLSFHLMLAAIRQGDWIQARLQCLNSRWASQVGPHRANQVASMLLTGNWSNDAPGDDGDTPEAVGG